MFWRTNRTPNNTNKFLNIILTDDEIPKSVNEYELFTCTFEDWSKHLLSENDFEQTTNIVFLSLTHVSFVIFVMKMKNLIQAIYHFTRLAKLSNI